MSKPSARTRAARAAIDALYATLPTIACSGACHGACGPIPLTVIEADRLRHATHRVPRTTMDRTCSLLTEGRRCGAYAVRPMVCRLYGLTKRMSCPHGCVPSRWLSDHEALALLQAAEQLGGRMVVTTPEGPMDIGETTLDIDPMAVSSAEAEADAETTLGLRALYGGRIIGVTRRGPAGGGMYNIDDPADRARLGLRKRLPP